MKPSDFLLALGLAIRQRRLEIGMSQEAFADLVGLHRTYVGGVERGERNLGVKNLAVIAGGLRLRISDLVAAAESMKGVNRRGKA